MIVGFPPQRTLDYSDVVSWMRYDLYSQALRDVVASTIRDDQLQRPTARDLYEICVRAQSSKNDRIAAEEMAHFLACEEAKRRPW